MTVSPDEHPADALLQRFALGKLDDAGVARIADHLESCSGCRSRAGYLPADRFVSYVRWGYASSGML
jgi:hypothetical protein